MKITVTNSLFHDAFHRFGRANQFSSIALDNLFQYYDETDDTTGEETELDVIAICCEWTEYDDDSEIIPAYGYLVEDDGFEDEHDHAQAIIEELHDHTTVIPCGGTYLVQEF